MRSEAMPPKTIRAIRMRYHATAAMTATRNKFGIYATMAAPACTRVDNPRSRAESARFCVHVKTLRISPAAITVTTKAVTKRMVLTAAISSAVISSAERISCSCQ